MLTRRRFLGALPAAALVCGRSVTPAAAQSRDQLPPEAISDFCRRLRPLGRILELQDWYVWCASPIYGLDGNVHLFFSRWPAERRMGGWINSSEIAHAVAPAPEAPFEVAGPVLQPRGPGFWDATTCHNPHVQRIDGKFCLFYMGNSNGRTDTKRIGLAVSDSLDGPWRRPDRPLLESGPPDAWDSHCTSNPAFVRHPNGQYWLYYKSWNTAEYENAPRNAAIRGNRKYGVAVADKLEGPYVKHPANPVIDFSGRGENRQFEDAYVWRQRGRFRMIGRDMGIFGHEIGLYLESDDGLRWSEPKVAYLPIREYASEPPAPPHLRKYGRLERPQLLLRDGKPTHLFTAAQGGAFMNSSPFVFRIDG
jgi:hypothetical protein